MAANQRDAEKAQAKIVTMEFICPDCIRIGLGQTCPHMPRQEVIDVPVGNAAKLTPRSRIVYRL